MTGGGVAWRPPGRSGIEPAGRLLLRVLPRLGPRPGDWGSRATWFAAGLVGLWLVFFLSGAGTPGQRVFVTDAVYLPVSVALVAGGVRVARNTRLDGRTRWAWWLITAAFALGGLGNLAWFWVEAVRQNASLATVAVLG
jgi:hypothetical protein